MQKYYVHEGNLERLQKQLKTIENKCKKYKLDFTFNILEPAEFRETVDEETGETHIARFIPVEAEGSISHGDWSFVAVLEHSKEGTVIRNYNKDLEVPVRYRDTPCRCEHCNTVRNRRDTYVIYNNETAEFKQVGKSCLMEYTQGISAEDVARYISLFESIIKGEAPSGKSWSHYYDTLELVQYTIECVKHWGYTKHDYEEQQYADAPRSTRTRVMDYLYLDHGWTTRVEVRERLQAELDAVGFKHNSEENKALAKEMIAWASAFDANSDNNYRHNLKVVCRKEAVDRRDIGILLSVVPAYYKHLNKIEEDAKREAEQKETAAVSKWVGQEGERITAKLQSFEHVYTGDSIYGPTYLFKMIDVDGNVMNWWTSSWIDLEDVEVVEVTGTVKKHEEYRGIKQTVLTRCKTVTVKIEKQKKEEAKVDEASALAAQEELDKALDVFYESLEE